MTTPGQEFKLRVPKNLVKDYYVMKLASAKPVKIDTVAEAHLSRKETQNEEDMAKAAPSFGAGSVYGKERKEEARKKRRGIITKQVNPEDLPFTLRFGPKNSKAKQYTGKKEGGILDNSSYFVLTQCQDGVFEAVPVHAWFNFTPDIHYTTMTADEAEYEFSKRDKTINFWNLKIKKQLDDRDDDEQEKKKFAKEKTDGELKIHDNEDLSDDVEVEEFSDDESDSDDAKKKKSKKQQAGKPQAKAGKKKKKGSDNEDLPSDEEEELENAESKEVDYHSESSDNEIELEDEPEPEKANAKAKDDLNADILSESSEDDEDENEEGEKLTDVGKELKQMLHRDEKEDGSSGEEDDEEDDIDGDETKSAVFMQGKDGKKKRSSGASGGNASGSNSRSATPTLSNDANGATAGPSTSSPSTSGSQGEHGKKKPGSKRPLQPSPSTSAKKAKMVGGAGQSSSTSSPSGAMSKHSHHRSHSHGSSGSSKDDEGEGAITEKAIRRYLSHKPMTTTDLVRKFKRKRTGLTKKQTVDTIAAILKKIEPHRDHKDNVLYLSLKPT